MDKQGLLLSSTASNKKAPPRQGRRAAPQPDDDIGSPDDLLESPVHSSSFSPAKFTASFTSNKGGKGEPIVPPRSRKTGGWADEAPKSKGSRRNSSNIIEQERFQSPERALRTDSDDDIPLIPDLDEMQEEELQNQVARAPSVVGTKVASFSELDSDLSKKSAFSTLDNINLSLLTSRIYSEEDVQEPNKVWMWDQLFTEVASDLRTEWENSVASKE